MLTDVVEASLVAHLDGLFDRCGKRRWTFFDEVKTMRE